MLFDVPTIGSSLPFLTVADEVTAAVTDGGLAVIQAPPGTGKTTLVPPIVASVVAASDGVAEAGRVVVTAPRRVAVRAAARRLAELSGTQLGDLVGYTVRGDRRVSRRTRVEFATPGVVIRRLLRDGDLENTAALVLDEVHERNLDSDLLLAMARDLRELRPDLHLLAMSATVDAPRFADLLGDDSAGAHRPAPIVAADAVLHELDIRYRPAPSPRLDARGVTREFLDHVARVAIDTAHDAPNQGDVLVFVPGVREVEHVATAVRAGLDDVSLEVFTLHGQLGAREQDRVIRGSAGQGAGPAQHRSHQQRTQRIIVSTAIAESSLTVPGVRAVVDACLSRGPRLDLARGMSGLVTSSSAKSSGEQRAGRAARLGPGIAVRCVSESQWQAAPEWPAPEIEVSDLTSAMLDLAAWGTPGGAGLRLVDAPPVHHADAANQTLVALGAVEASEAGASGQITEFGRQLSTLPLDPRLGRALLLTASLVEPSQRSQVAEAVALVDDPPRGDLTRAGGQGAGDRGADRAHADRLLRLIKDVPAQPDPNAPTLAGFTDILGTVTALAWPDRIARRRGAHGTEYLFTSGTAASVPPQSAGLQSHEWLAVADVSRAGGNAAGRAGAVIRSAAPISADIAHFAAQSMAMKDTDIQVSDRSPVKVTARTRERLGAIELAAHPARPTPEQCRSALLAWLASDSSHINALSWSAEATALRARLALLHREIGDPWPDVTDAGLATPETAATVLGSDLDSPTPGAITVTSLQGILPWPEASHLDELAPERLEVPSGSRIKVDYSGILTSDESAPPILAVKLQECFGLSETPTIAGGRVPVLMHLLSPAGRPLAVTQDLASFWNGAYAHVRSEMRGRYPKHPWPENPWTFQATRHTKRRM
ncbi:ATP-dependent helicase HrpB [Corynebacterium sp. H78]|uniref:ATP-dependent helicase HrpB n=1 Tax=Corynebacterium sp. H78 TaxID=3133417 RepID=UPI0030AD2DB4